MDIAELQDLMEDHKTKMKTVKLHLKSNPQEKQKELNDIKHMLQKKMKQLVQDRYKNTSNNAKIKT